MQKRPETDDTCGKDNLKTLDDEALFTVAGAAQTPAELLSAMPGPLRAALQPLGPRRYVPWIPPASQ